MSIRKHLLLLVIGVALPLVLLLGWSLADQYQRERASASEGALRLAQITAVDTASFITQTRALLERLAAREDVRALDPARCSAPVFALGEVLPGYTAINLWRADGTLVCSTAAGAPRRAPLAESFAEALKANGFMVTSPIRGQLTGRWAVLTGFPVRDAAGRTAGLISAPIDLENFRPIVAQADVPAGTTIVIFDSKGKIISQTADASRIGQTVQSPNVERMLAEKRGIIQAENATGVERITGFHAVEGTGWIAVASVPAEALLGEAREKLRLTLLLAVAALGLAALGGWSMKRRIAPPVRAIAAAARRIGAGEQDVAVPVDGPDEVARVGSELNRMLEDLRAHAQRVERLTWIHATLSETNQMIVRVRERNELFQKICEICVEKGRALIATIRVLQGERLVLAAHASRLPAERMPREDSVVLGKGGVEVGLYSEAIRTGKACFSNDNAADPRFGRWKEAAGLSGVRASAVLPIACLGETVGVLSVHVAEKGFFDDEISRLLHEMAVDMGFALESMERERQRAEAEATATANSERLSRVFNLSPEPMALYANSDGRVLDANQAYFEFFGRTRAEIVGVPARRLGVIWMDSKERADIGEKLRLRGSLRDEEVRFKHAGGSERIALMSLLPFDPPGKGGGRSELLIAVMRDITTRKQAERALWESNVRLQALSTRLLEAHESERTRIARELHDEIGQALTAIKIRMQVLGRDQHAPERVASIVDLVDDALMQVRQLSQDLRPPQLDDLGIAAALRALLNRVLSPAGFAFDVTVEPPTLSPEDPVAVACYRITQEALTNVLRHSKASKVSVRLEAEPGGVRLTVADDGAGFDPSRLRDRALRGDSTGMLGMEERAKLAGGELRIDSSPAAGTRIIVFFASRAKQPEAGERDAVERTQES